MNTLRVEIYINERSKHSWRIRAANGRIICTPGEDFATKRGAYRSFETVREAMGGVTVGSHVLPIVDLTEKESRRG